MSRCNDSSTHTIEAHFLRMQEALNHVIGPVALPSCEAGKNARYAVYVWHSTAPNCVENFGGRLA